MERSTIVRVHEGLHARPATRFVKLAKGFESDVELVKDGKAVSAKSSVKLMLLAVKENQEVTVRANGADAIEAIEALIGYLENPKAGLDDEAEPQSPANDAGQEAPPPPARQSAPGEANGLRGVAASEGVAIGPAFAHFPPDIAGQGRLLQADEIAGEIDRFRAAVAAVQARMDRALAQDSLSAGDRGIVAALRDIAADDSLTGEAEKAIKGGNDAVSAVITAASAIAADFSAVDDHYLNARADDVHAVGRQICLVLLGQDDVSLENIPEGAILIADDIGAWDLARAPLKRIGGVVCGHGGATSHIAIIARSHGIPAVLGLGDQVNALRTARDVALDGNTGHVIIDPDAATRADYAGRVEAAAKERAGLTAFKTVTPKRADGKVIEVAANIGSLEEIEAAQEAGAMGVGLFRTELLFMRHMHLPSEDMQAETYAALAKAFETADDPSGVFRLAGEPYQLVSAPVLSPELIGWVVLPSGPIFSSASSRALLRAAVHGNIKVMLPMVADISEVTRTRALVDECAAELKAEGVPHATFDLGVMIETPAAVLIAPALAKEVAFLSIGTNDLTQYIMAADRLNPTVAKLNDVTNPAVMMAIELTAKAGVAAGIMVGMCGEAAGRPDLIPAFIEMGLTELSMSPASIQRAKKTITAMAAGN